MTTEMLENNNMIYMKLYSSVVNNGKYFNHTMIYEYMIFNLFISIYGIMNLRIQQVGHILMKLAIKLR